MAEDRANSQTSRSEQGRFTGGGVPAGEPPASGEPLPHEGSPSPEDSPRGNSSGGGDALTYEQARDQLGEVVRRLEAGGTTLEESLALWERGEALATICEQRLNGVRARLAEAGAPETKPHEDEGSRSSGVDPITGQEGE